MTWDVREWHGIFFILQLWRCRFPRRIINSSLNVHEWKLVPAQSPTFTLDLSSINPIQAAVKVSKCELFELYSMYQLGKNWKWQYSPPITQVVVFQRRWTWRQFAKQSMTHVYWLIKMYSHIWHTFVNLPQKPMSSQRMWIYVNPHASYMSYIWT